MVFYHAGRDLSLAVHGDDFTFCGLEEDLRWIRALMETWFEIKVRGVLGPGKGAKKEVTILGRKVVWGEEGITYEADPKHRELVMEGFGFCEKSKESKYNGLKEDREVEDEDEELVSTEATEYRGVAARAN